MIGGKGVQKFKVIFFLFELMMNVVVKHHKTTFLAQSFHYLFGEAQVSLVSNGHSDSISKCDVTLLQRTRSAHLLLLGTHQSCSLPSA